MARNSKLMDLINDAEDNYGKPSNWPEKVTEKINTKANRINDYEHTPANEVLRHLICHGYTNTQITLDKQKSSGYIQSLRKQMKNNGELHFQATPDELTQLKYTVKHMNKPNNQGIARVMHRDKDWVRCMREKLREADNEARR
ncbi:MULTISPECIES: hypothetical protein [Levilactobacillus]|uniref:hypothetical protein n=1 Tax=Levilactobacillus TaxID=2767886 RepID=UPI002165B769|nr:hypothetical protein [Levilactobacillus brevis]MCT3565310.1 hypothetical protein [Levilactobacillus brevis]UVW18072.1 hypothetical protein NX820_09160 [Levilactobacillus brevis]